MIHLTPAEAEVLRSMCRGIGRSEVAVKTNRQEQTVRNLLSSVYRKCGFSPERVHKSARACYLLGRMDERRKWWALHA